MKIQEIRNLEIDKIMDMSQTELKKLVQQIAKVVNPRVNRLSNQAYGGKIATDALDYIEKSGGLMTTTGQERRTANGDVSYLKTINELRHEVVRGQRFLNMKTSTVRSAREIQKQRMGKFYEIPDISIDERKRRASEAWDDFHKFLEEHQNIPYKTALALYEYRTSDNVEQFNEVIEKYLKRVEEEEKKAYEEISKQTGYKPQWEGF